MSIDAQPSHGPKVRRTLIYRRARACPSPASFSQKASRRGRALLLPCIPLLIEPVRLSLTCSRTFGTCARPSGDRELQGPPCTTPLCSAGSPDADLFAIRRSRTTGAVPLCSAGSPDPARAAPKNQVSGTLFYEIPLMTAGGMPPVLNVFLDFSVNLHILF